MKHISFFILLISVFILSSCNFTKENSVKVNNVDGSIRVKEFTYNGHTYLEFKDDAEYGIAIEHDPECKKCFDFFD